MLRLKFYLGLLPMLLLLVLVGWAGIVVCNDLARSNAETIRPIADIVRRSAGKVRRSYAIMSATQELREAAKGVAQALQAGLGKDPFEAKSVYEQQRGRFKKVLMGESFTAAAGDPARAKAIEQVSDAFDRMEKLGDRIFGRGGSVSSQTLYFEIESAYAATQRALDNLLATDSREMQAESKLVVGESERVVGEAERVANIARVSVRVIWGAIAAGIVISLLVVLLLGRVFVRPIRELTATARALGEGNLDRDVPVKTRDELGVLARTFNTMLGKLREYREAMTARVVRAQRTMEATLTSTPDPLFIITPGGVVDISNPAAEILMTLPEFANGLPAPLGERVREVLRTQEHFLPTGYDQVIALHVNRDERFFLPRILYVGDKLTGAGSAAMILQDVTKFRLLDHAKSNLVGTVSHELKTPLTSLRMAVYLMLEQNTRAGSLTPAQRELLETARDDADRLLRILNDILDLARIESGAASINCREVNVRDMLDEMAREMRQITADAGQRVTVRVADGVRTVHADPERLRHVFINLLNNASKYSPADSEITLYAEPDIACDGTVRFGVCDCGPGLTEADAARVFEKFYRVPGQTRKGAGIGLTIAREIVLAHGGTIACESKPGEGSDFYFMIPPGGA